MLQNQFLKRVFALAEHSGGVGQQKRHSAPIGRLLDHVAGGPGCGVDDRAPCAGNTVEKCRFSDIGAADQNDGWELFGGHV